MDKLTDAQLAYWKRWAEKRPTRYDLSPAILSLIAEVREGRKLQQFLKIDTLELTSGKFAAECAEIPRPLWYW